MYKRLFILAALLVPAAVINILVAWWFVATQASATRLNIPCTLDETPFTSWPAEFGFPYTDTSLLAHFKSRGRDIYQFNGSGLRLEQENVRGQYLPVTTPDEQITEDFSMPMLDGSTITGSSTYFVPGTRFALFGQVDTYISSKAYMKLLHWGWPARTLAVWSGQKTNSTISLPTGDSLDGVPQSLFTPVATVDLEMDTWDAPLKLAKQPVTVMGAECDITALPRRVLPIGAIINTLFYALLLYLPFELFFLTRYMTRTRRGRCRKCGYDTQGLTTCPECGTAVPTK